MNTVDFFGKKVTKLIVGDNPFNGHSYILETSGKEMTDFYTAEKIKETMFRIEAEGYNTMLPLADPYIIRLIKEYQRDGGKMQFVFQPYMPMDQKASMNQIAFLENVIGIYHQGSTTDCLYETDRANEIPGNIAEYRQLGVPVGLGTHYPEVIELSEKEEWGADFYMGCLHNKRRFLKGEPSGFLSGKSTAGMIFYAADRAPMLDVLRKTQKPAIAFKIFAGGQMFSQKTEEEKRALIKGVYEEVFTALKPNDFAAIGVFQRDKDEVKENADIPLHPLLQALFSLPHTEP